MRFKPLAANDIFISYPRKDATTYAEGLATKLNEKNLSCFTDTLGTDAGKDLPEGLIRELKSCKMLVVLCSETTGQSYVTTEISTYIEAKGSSRTIVPVVFDKTVMNEKWYSAIEGIAAVFEPGEELVTGNPSDAVVNRIDKAFTYSRSKERLRKYTIGASVVLAVLLVLIGVASLIAVLQLREAKTQGQEAAAQILSANAVSNLDIDPEVSLLLATRAVPHSRTPAYPAARRSCRAMDCLKPEPLRTAHARCRRADKGCWPETARRSPDRRRPPGSEEFLSRCLVPCVAPLCKQGRRE